MEVCCSLEQGQSRIKGSVKLFPPIERRVVGDAPGSTWK